MICISRGGHDNAQNLLLLAFRPRLRRGVSGDAEGQGIGLLLRAVAQDSAGDQFIIAGL